MTPTSEIVRLGRQAERDPTGHLNRSTVVLSATAALFATDARISTELHRHLSHFFRP